MDELKKYKPDRVPHELLFVVGRTAMILLVNLFATVSAVLFCSLAATILGLCFENSNDFVRLKLVPFLTSGNTTSFIGWMVLLAIMLRLFWDDGKRQTAYGRYNLGVGFLAVFFMFAVYYIPSIFIDRSKDALEAALVLYYRPCAWLSDMLGGSVSLSVMITGGLLAFVCLIFYKLSSDRYLKKYGE